MPRGFAGILKKIYWSFRSVKNFWLFVLDHAGFIKKEEYILKTHSGLSLLVRSKTTDKSEVALIFSNKEYPKRYFPQNDRPVIIDIGAHIGCFSLYVGDKLKLNKPKIYSIEPSDENFRLLAENMHLNGFNFQCFKLAISNYEGNGYLDIKKSSDSFCLKKTVTPRDRKSCQLTSVSTLENFCKLQKVQKIDLLKIDCEGEEYKIFKSSIKFLKEKVKYIFAEVHNINSEENYLKFEKFVKENNFLVVCKMFPTVVFLKNLNL